MMKKQASRSVIAYTSLLITFFIWGSIYVAAKYATDSLPPAFVACMRHVTALLPLFLLSRGQLHTKIDRKDYLYFAIIGISGYFMTVFINTVGISLAGASTAALVNSLNPVFIAIMAAIVLKERIGLVRALCIALAVVGTCVVVSGAQDKTQINGVLLVLISVLTWSFASVYIRKLTQKYPAALVTIIGVLISLVFHIPNAVISIVRAGGISCTLPTALAVLYLGLIGTGLAQYFWCKSLSMLEATTCSLFYPLQPFFSAILGAILLGEQFSLRFLIGSILIVADVLLICIYNHRQAHAALKEPPKQEPASDAPKA